MALYFTVKQRLACWYSFSTTSNLPMKSSVSKNANNRSSTECLSQRLTVQARSWTQREIREDDVVLFSCENLSGAVLPISVCSDLSQGSYSVSNIKFVHAYLKS